VIVNAGYINQWQHKGHVMGQCMSHPDMNLMYVNIPKNASSWTKPNLLDWGWEFYNYRTDGLNKPALVVLRDPVDRWLSGIAEYFTLYHPGLRTDEITLGFLDLVFDRITFDDHTDLQVKFIEGLDTEQCTFFWCDHAYKEKFSKFLNTHNMTNRYFKYADQHVSKNSPVRSNWKTLFGNHLENSKYLAQVKDYFKQDYELIEKVTFYDYTRQLNK
jgi:hypothetical protein